MKFSVLTLFPELIEGFCGQGLLGTAREKNLVQIECVNPRTFTSDVHGTVDDRAFGGGDGMVMKPEPLAAAVESLEKPVRVVVLSPSGRVWDQSVAREWALSGGHVALVCGRYAGIDQRFVEKYAEEEISLGNFVLNGGELAALSIVESVTRLLPGALGNSVSAACDSFSDGRLEAPQFTRPREWSGMPVPSPLLSGNHAEIEKFLRAAGLVQTALRRPDWTQSATELKEAAGLLLKLPDAELSALGVERESVKKFSVSP
jgi:tRNA (guanine37-N1)-methyltransferase